LIGTHAQDVEGFVLHHKGDPNDKTVVQIVGRVDDPEWLHARGLSFFIRLPKTGEVTVATAESLSPWWPH